MSRYRTIPHIIEATQFRPDGNHSAVRFIEANRVDIPARGIKVDRPARFEAATMYGRMDIKYGDWIVETSLGIIVMPDFFFKHFYEVVH